MSWFAATFEQPPCDQSFHATGPVSPEQDARFGAGHETDEAMLFPEDSIPWDELAFPVTRIALERFLGSSVEAQSKVNGDGDMGAFDGQSVY